MQQRDHWESYLHVASPSNSQKPPWKVLLSYYRPTTFLLYRINKPRMEEIGTTISKYQPLRVLCHPLCDYARLTTLSHLICSFSRELVPSLFEESITQSSSTSVQPFFWYSLIKSFLSPQKIFTQQSFFYFFLLFHFHHTLFSWACMSLFEPRKFFQTLFLYIHLFVKLLIHFFMNFSQICISTSPTYALPVILFSAWSKH